MTVRVNLWSSPRNVSTAMMYAWRQRADTVVVDEPLYAHYLRVSGRVHPGRDEVLASQEIVGETVVRTVVLGDHPRPVAFFKHMAKHLVDLDRGPDFGLAAHHGHAGIDRSFLVVGKRVHEHAGIGALDAPHAILRRRCDLVLQRLRLALLGGQHLEHGERRFQARAQRVALGGGCFLNHVLTADLRTRLHAAGIEVFETAAVSPGDAGLSLGQAWVALARTSLNPDKPA